jgi:Ca2+/Na+ antiporter
MFIDPRGPRFAAALTAVVLALVVITGNAWLLAAQAVVFALGALGRSPYGVIFRRLVRPRLGAPTELEHDAPPRFAQGVGLAFALAGLAGFAAGSTLVGIVATSAALAAAFLNAAFGVCLGCEVYLLARRATSHDTVRSDGTEPNDRIPHSHPEVAA